MNDRCGIDHGGATTCPHCSTAPSPTVPEPVPVPRELVDALAEAFDRFYDCAHRGMGGAAASSGEVFDAARALVDAIRGDA